MLESLSDKDSFGPADLPQKVLLTIDLPDTTYTYIVTMSKEPLATGD